MVRWKKVPALQSGTSTEDLKAWGSILYWPQQRLPSLQPPSMIIDCETDEVTASFCQHPSPSKAPPAALESVVSLASYRPDEPTFRELAPGPAQSNAAPAPAPVPPLQAPGTSRYSYRFDPQTKGALREVETIPVCSANPERDPTLIDEFPMADIICTPPSLLSEQIATPELRAHDWRRRLLFMIGGFSLGLLVGVSLMLVIDLLG